MYKSETENIEVYFICYKKEEMELVETYYDDILDIHCWYFNAYLAYKYWKKKFKGLKIQETSKKLLIVAASKYLIYRIENEEYETEQERKRLLKDLEKIQPELQKITNEDSILAGLN